MLYIIIIVLGFTIIGGLIKFFRRRDLRSTLGLEVGDNELVSLTSWIEAEENVDKKTQS